MVWFIITHIFSTLVEYFSIGRLSEREKDLEIHLLRHQLDILERKQKVTIQPNHGEREWLSIRVQKMQYRPKANG